MIKDYSLLYDLAKSYIASGLVVPKKIAKVILGRISKVTITKTSNQTVKIFEEKVVRKGGVMRIIRTHRLRLQSTR